MAAQSEIHALPNGQFFILARDSGFGHGQDESLSVYRHIDVFDISGATDISGDTYDCEDCAVADDDGDLVKGITAATYCSFLDFNVNSQLERFGMHNGGDQDSTLLVSNGSTCPLSHPLPSLSSILFLWLWAGVMLYSPMFGI